MTAPAIPQAVESEAALIGAALIDAPATLAAAGPLAPVDFYSEAHRRLWTAVRAASRPGKPIDPATLRQHLGPDSDHLQKPLADAMGVGIPALAAEYAEAIRAAAGQRRVISAAAEISAAAMAGRADALDVGMKKLAAIKASAGPVEGLPIVSAADLLESEFPEADEIIAGILPAKSKAIISGPAKLGKSRFLTGLLLGIATGQDVMGFRIPTARPVLVLQSEVSERSLQKRLQKIRSCFPCDADLLRRNLHFCNAPLKLTRPEHAAAIAQAVRDTGAEVVAVDPLYRYHTGDENSVRDLGLAFDPLDALIADYGVAIVLCHHHGKQKTEGNASATTAHLNRGSSTISDWPDSLLTLQWRDRAAEIVRLDFTLRNDAEPPAMAFKRNADTLLFDPLPDFQFDGRKRATKCSDKDVAQAAGKQGATHAQLVGLLMHRFDVSERTAKTAISRADRSGAVTKNPSTGKRYAA